MLPNQSRIDQIEGIIDAHSEKAPAEAMSEVMSIAEEFAASTPMVYPPGPGGAFGRVINQPA